MRVDGDWKEKKRHGGAERGSSTHLGPALAAGGCCCSGSASPRFMVFDRWAAIRGFALGDTDDNMRMMQVRGLLDGQGWYDLSQYRLNPPVGADIHWSRLVDLPIAGAEAAAHAASSAGAIAEQVAVAVAPLLPMLVAMAALAVTARRLIAPHAFALAIALLACAGSATRHVVSRCGSTIMAGSSPCSPGASPR